MKRFSVLLCTLLVGSCATAPPKKQEVPSVATGNVQSNGDCVSQSPGSAYANGLVNLATKGTASQSSTGHWSWDAAPGLANDGNSDGDYMGHSVSHTLEEHRAWWQVDLGDVYAIEKIVIWNRTDGGWGKRLSNFNLIVLDSSNNPIFEQTYCRGDKSFSPAMVVDMARITNGRYVKIMLNGKNYLQLAEVEIFAKN